jgi:hypothetical protein
VISWFSKFAHSNSTCTATPRGAATRDNRWSVVVERHRNLRKLGRRDERVFAASFGRQQAALGKQITAGALSLLTLVHAFKPHLSCFKASLLPLT